MSLPQKKKLGKKVKFSAIKFRAKLKNTLSSIKVRESLSGFLFYFEANLWFICSIEIEFVEERKSERFLNKRIVSLKILKQVSKRRMNLNKKYNTILMSKIAKMWFRWITKAFSDERTCIDYKTCWKMHSQKEYQKQIF